MGTFPAYTTELIRGRDDAIAGSGLVRPIHDAECVRAFNVSTRPVPSHARVTVAEHDGAYWIITVEP